VVQITLGFAPTVPANYTPIVGSLVFATTDADGVADNNTAQTWINLAAADAGVTVTPGQTIPMGDTANATFTVTANGPVKSCATGINLDFQSDLKFKQGYLVSSAGRGEPRA
jgi:hypothetical protein